MDAILRQYLFISKLFSFYFFLPFLFYAEMYPVF